jgi:hypothetical protein
MITKLGCPFAWAWACEEDPFGLPRPARVVGGVNEVLAEALEFVNASEYFSDNVALADVCGGLACEDRTCGRGARTPARGVHAPLTGDECTMDCVLEMGMEVAWGEERCVVSCSDVCPLVFPQADLLAPRFQRGGEPSLGCTENRVR